MSNINLSCGTIAILTGGGDVPGLNPAIRGVTLRAIRDGYKVIGLRRGWAGITEINRDLDKKDPYNQNCYMELTYAVARSAARTGGTFLHTSRTRPSHMKKDDVPAHYQASLAAYLREDTKDGNEEDKRYDLTPEVVKNLEFLGIDYLIAIGGDDTLSYAVTLHKAGVKVIAIPKTMDNDVPGTDYCTGFSTCVTRTIQLANELRTAVSSHERFMVMEVFGRNAGFTAMLPTLAGAADRCVIPEEPFDIERLCWLMCEDRRKNPNNYASVLVSEGASFAGKDIPLLNTELDAYGHPRLGGIGKAVGDALKEVSPKYNDGKPVNIMVQNLTYIIRCGEPDFIDSIVPMMYGNLAMDLIAENTFGMMAALVNGKYDTVPIEAVISRKKVVNAEKYYVSKRMRPRYDFMKGNPMLLMSAEE